MAEVKMLPQLLSLFNFPDSFFLISHNVIFNVVVACPAILFLSNKLRSGCFLDLCRSSIIIPDKLRLMHTRTTDQEKKAASRVVGEVREGSTTNECSPIVDGEKRIAFANLTWLT